MQVSRFEVNERGCWVWLLRKNRNGYGERFFMGKKRLAHRCAFFEAFGYWPKEIAHDCHNRACVNPAHLKDSTRVANIRESNKTKLTALQVKDIREHFERGESKRSLARRFGVGRSQILRIVRMEQWQ